VQTFILLSAVMFVLVNLAVDLLYAAIDPRVRIPSAVAA
jgi:ABC-type dipeptide/oligopeptide/nickel transport system permease component